jgi:hypothetical protein
MECKNCNRIVEDKYNFCPYCGQKRDISRLNFKQLINNLWVAFSNTDQGILLLVKELTYRPGKVAREYISGKRKTYFNPFSFLVLTVAIALYFILKFESLAINYAATDPQNLELLHFAFKYFNVFILIMCPIYGVLIWLFFWGNRTNFVENLALAAYLSGQTMIYYIIALVIFMIFPRFLNVLGIIFGFSISMWYVIAVLQFYRTRTLWSIIKTLLIIIITQILTQGIILSSFATYNKWGT